MNNERHKQSRGSHLGKKPLFQGFPELRSNVLYCPKQFFTVVVPNSSLNCIRLVGYLLRKTLGWVDENGDIQQEQHRFTYRTLIEKAGISNGGMQKAIDEALSKRFIRRVVDPRVQEAGVSAISGVYELAWDSAYTDRVEDFRGFCLEDTGRRNIPNVFFDHIIRYEALGVIRVVGTLLWYSITWGKGGERRQPVKKSLRELEKLTGGLERTTITRALNEAEANGYIDRLQRGSFSVVGDGDRSVTVYTIRWTASESAYVTEEEDVLENAPNLHHRGQPRTLQICTTEVSSERSKFAPQNAPNLHHKERSKFAPYRNTNNRTTNTLNNNSTRTPPDGAESQAVVVAEADEKISRLVKAGFSRKVASEIASRATLPVIVRQIEVLPLRHPARNPLGMLRAAIEGDWEVPESKTTDVGSSAKQFASGFYAGYHANPDSPVSDPSRAEVDVATKFLDRLTAVIEATPDQTHEAKALDRGREFGSLVRFRERRNEKATPNFILAVRRYGDEFFTEVQRSVKQERERALAENEAQRYQTLQPRYDAFVKEEVERHWNEESDLRKQFQEARRAQEERLRASAKSMRLDLSAAVERFREGDRESFELFLLEKEAIPGFEEWAGSVSEGSMAERGGEQRSSGKKSQGRGA